MERMKLLELTEIIVDLNEKGQERVDSIVRGTQKTGVVNKQWFLEQNLPVPPEFEDEEEEIDENGFIELKEDERKYIYFKLLLNEDELSRVHESEDQGSEIVLKNGISYWVKETVEEIKQQIIN